MATALLDELCKYEDLLTQPEAEELKGQMPFGVVVGEGFCCGKLMYCYCPNLDSMYTAMATVPA